MTDTKTIEPTDTESTDKKNKLEFNLPQIAGGALAAVTTAALGSRLGTAGTLAGAGVASVIAAVAGTVYTNGLERTRDGVKRIVLRDGDGNAEVVEVTELEDGSETELTIPAPAGAAPPAPKARRWRTPLAVAGGMALSAAASFAVAMGVVTGVEVGSGQSLDGNTGTTLGQATKASPSATPTPTPTATATPTATPTTASATPTPIETPTVLPEPSTSEPTAQPSTGVSESATQTQE